LGGNKGQNTKGRYDNRKGDKK